VREALRYSIHTYLRYSFSRELIEEKIEVEIKNSCMSDQVAREGPADMCFYKLDEEKYCS
jgi:hypothetical protein